MLKKFKIKVNGNQYDVEVEEMGKMDNSVEGFEKTDVDKEYTSLKMPRPEKMFESIIRGDAVKAPINGTVLDIMISESEMVRQGDVLLILEAMKMENEITSPKDGKVKEIAVSKNDKVDTGDILIKIS
ncbi:MAG: biotin/lipoyl-containing protein [Bacillota bacterium]